MSLFGGSKSSGSDIKPSYTGLQIQTSASTIPLPIVFGRVRVAPNLVWYRNFQAHAVESSSSSSSGGKGGGSCFAPEVVVSGPTGGIPIGKILIGDAVWCVNPDTGEKVEGRVEAVHVHDMRESSSRIMWLEHSGGRLHVTDNHHIIDADDYHEVIEAGHLVRGDALVHEFAEGVEVASVVSAPFIPFTFNLTISPFHNFFADGILVHNGGGGKSTTTGYTYTADVILGLCEGPISSIGTVYDGNATTSISALGLSMWTGAGDQDVWGYLTSTYPGEALSYPWTAYLAAANFDLGSSAAATSYNFEVFGQLSGTGINGLGDADPVLAAVEILTNPRYGVGFKSEWIDSASWYSSAVSRSSGDDSWQTYCRALGIDISANLSNRETAASVLGRWLQLTNTAVFWSGTALKVAPYGDEAVGGSGYIFAPDLSPVANLTDDDFVRIEGSDEDPVLVERVDVADAPNAVTLEWTNVGNQYTQEPAQAFDQTSIDIHGYRPASTVTGHEITTSGAAQTVVELLKNRSVTIRNEYTFSLSWEYCHLEPMDVVYITDDALNLLGMPVRILSLEEQDDTGIITVTAEQLVHGSNTAARKNVQIKTGDALDTNVQVPPVHPPLIFEPPLDLSGSTPQVWIAASGGANAGQCDQNWGGANIWISLDNASYSLLGRITAPANMGLLVSDVAENSTSITVNLTESGGLIDSGTFPDVESGSTLCVLGSELIVYETAELIGSHLYRLSGLTRGYDGTIAEAHVSGALFAKVDNAIAKFDIATAIFGRTIYLKLQSFNIFGRGVQDISTCAVYSYTPGDRPPGRCQGLTGVGGKGFVSLSWVLPLDGDIAFTEVLYSETDDLQTAVQAGEPTGTTFTHTGLVGFMEYYYWVRAVDLGGHVGPVNQTPGTKVKTEYIELSDIGRSILDKVRDDIATSVPVIDLASTLTTLASTAMDDFKANLAAKNKIASRVADVETTVEQVVDDTQALASEITTVGSKFDEAMAVAQRRIEALTLATEASAKMVDTLQAKIAEASAALATEAQVRATNDGAAASLVTTAAAELNGSLAAVTDQLKAYVDGGSAVASSLREVQTTVGEHSTQVALVMETRDGIMGKGTFAVDADGVVTGISVVGKPGVSAVVIQCEEFALKYGNTTKVPFAMGEVNGQPAIVVPYIMIGDGTIGGRSIQSLACTNVAAAIGEGVRSVSMLCQAGPVLVFTQFMHSISGKWEYAMTCDYRVVEAGWQTFTTSEGWARGMWVMGLFK